MATETSTFWGADSDQLRATDPELAGAVLGEPDRCRGGRHPFAGGHLTSSAVLAASGSTLTDKYPR
ncbi:hypothetical protein [Micromonospora sp. CPCC 205561]|uniref:hypothetical protein n=1 Tax=Micromonospora sp. CPCC 205561 TaxID=3122407 RepID=UPI002FEF6127